MSPGAGQRAAKARQRRMFPRLISRSDTRRFNSIHQLECSGRTANGRRYDRRVPDLQADLHRTNRGKRCHEHSKDGDPHSPTKLSDACVGGVRRLWLHPPLVHR